jgi:hypothetical protein
MYSIYMYTEGPQIGLLPIPYENKWFLWLVRERTNMNGRCWNWSPAPHTTSIVHVPTISANDKPTKNAKRGQENKWQPVGMRTGIQSRGSSYQADQQHRSCFSILWPECRYKCKTFGGWCKRWKNCSRFFSEYCITEVLYIHRNSTSQKPV